MSFAVRALFQMKGNTNHSKHRFMHFQDERDTNLKCGARSWLQDNKHTKMDKTCQKFITEFWCWSPLPPPSRRCCWWWWCFFIVFDWNSATQINKTGTSWISHSIIILENTASVYLYKTSLCVSVHIYYIYSTAQHTDCAFRIMDFFFFLFSWSQRPMMLMLLLIWAWFYLSIYQQTYIYKYDCWNKVYSHN